MAPHRPAPPIPPKGDPRDAEGLLRAAAMDGGMALGGVGVAASIPALRRPCDRAEGRPPTSGAIVPGEWRKGLA